MTETQAPHMAPEPYKIKMVERIRLLPRAKRESAIKEAGHNTFLLKSEDVFIDLLTDSGTNAMTDTQWAAMLTADEAYAGARSYYRFVDAVQEVYGYRYVLPVHQGRAAENILSKILIKPGDVVPGNMYFTTTRLHQELAGGAFVDVIIDEAHDPSSEHPFKGNVDLGKLAAAVEKAGPGKVPYVAVGAPVNMAGGQPVSLGNLREVSKFCRSAKIPLVLDAARAVENAYFIKEREPGYADKSVKAILREMCALTDAAAMSAKKDAYANIGGFLAVNDEGVYREAQNLCVVYEGLHTYGGLAGRDLEALARGFRESVESDEWISHRVAQVRYLWSRLDEGYVPMVRPCGGHAVFLDARAILPHLRQEELPAQSLCAALYAQCGVRAMERGIVSAGRDAKTGENHKPALELVRLALPRRVYTQSHLDYVAEGVIETARRSSSIPGLKFAYEPKYLRFFQARFEPVGRSLAIAGAASASKPARKPAPVKAHR
ncbi:MAG TPA: tryptophanase [Elusimicrobiota bacterium]|nr:tryptophanase [Elusimicrobiota bacterium]